MNPQVSSVEDAAEVDAPRRRGPSIWQIVVMVLVVGAVGGWMARTYLPASHPGRDSVDVGFLNDMSTHHQQAIQMGLTYQQRGTDPLLGQMAREIVVSQAAEIGAMNQILEAWGEHDPPEQSMAWMGHAAPSSAMPGMATPAELAGLAKLSGRALDDEFSRLMIAHHAGGLAMAEYAAAHASDASVRRRAKAMAEGQQSEILELNKRRSRAGPGAGRTLNRPSRTHCARGFVHGPRY